MRGLAHGERAEHQGAVADRFVARDADGSRERTRRGRRAIKGAGPAEHAWQRAISTPNAGLTGAAGDGMGAPSAPAIGEARRTMAKPELGNKRVCVACSARFYDLNRVPAICPKCNTEQPAEQPRLKRPGGNVVLEEKRRPKVLPVPGLEETGVEVEVAEEETEEDVLEDTSDLEGGDETVVDVEIEPEPGEEER